MPLGLFRSRTFTTINLATFFVYGGLYVTLSYQSIMLQGALGYTALAAGAVVLPDRDLPHRCCRRASAPSLGSPAGKALDGS